ncbi:MAG TPA: L-2-amino-thiazoline-4-carboxylic acid hydrolase [Candidatus Dormibacteraeota bacterium]|nr:L-2-amino-thiazoline-4-carboxylic acid hydrolase [Candidatus Dormibacteraeota bacterium]
MAHRVPRLMRWQAGWALRKRVAPRKTEAVLRSADDKYVAPPHLAQTSAGVLNLEMGAYLLALRDALVEIGVEGENVNELLAESLYRVMKRFYGPIDALAIVVHPMSRLARSRWRQALSRRFFFRPPDWQMVEVTATRGHGFDVRRCVMAEYMSGRGEQRFCQEVICKQDLLMAQARAEVLMRTLTIAAGDDRCDFRFAPFRERGGTGLAVQPEP